jgi:lysine 2,3-aminomutase
MAVNKPTKKPASFGTAQDLQKVSEHYAVRITPSVFETIKDHAPHDPVARQYIPDSKELIKQPQELDDPIGDKKHSPVEGIVHRYPDRVLLMPVSSCAVYCRYCFRREFVGKGPALLGDDKLKAALEYIKKNKQIWEVILTGGDPLVLSARRLTELMEVLSEIEHVKIIRIHTKLPIVDPTRVNDSLLHALDTNKALYMALHINHANELSEDVITAIRRLRDCGISLLSQSVLLRGVNDNADTLEALYRALVSEHVKPYYLHHLDRANGTGHFRVSIDRGQAIIKELKARMSGLCLPTYMLDIPGGYGKIPLTPQYIKIHKPGQYELEDTQGRRHPYTCS